LIAILLVVSVQAACDSEDEKRFVYQGNILLGEAWPGPEQNQYSQGNEEVIIRDFFEDRRDGVFLDVGSSTPIQFSTTYYLEKHLGWTGIAIDALKQHAKSYRKERPHTKFFSYFVTDQSGTKVDFYHVLYATGLSSGTEPTNTQNRKISVPTITLNDLLERNGIDSIDFMSMDIEGGEPKALAGFDIAKYQPQLVAIEGRTEATADYFADYGYEPQEKYRRYDHINWYYSPISKELADESTLVPQ
jgi:FkbM family methyltransferase